MKARVAYRTSLGVAFFFALVNCVVAVRVFMLSRSPISYNVKVVQPPPPPSFDSLTNFSSRASLVDSPSLSSNIAATASTFAPGRELAALSYHYFSVGGRPHIRLHDAYYISGDATAYGVIDLIFPERVYFRGGDWISNTFITYNRNIDQKEVHAHDQRRDIDTRIE